MSAHIRSIAIFGSQGIAVDIECHLSNNIPGIVIVGFASKSTDEAKERVRGAFANSGLVLPRKRITINLAPADIPKDGSSFDLGMAMSILRASHQTELPDAAAESEAYLGELGLDGTVRPIRGIIGKLMAGRKAGIKTFYIPEANLDQSLLVPNITLYPVKNLEQLYKHGTSSSVIQPIKTGEGSYRKPDRVSENLLSEVAGQDQAKRALQIAAAGGHNVFFVGPPGTGKSMLAKAFPSILPDLTHEEMLEVTHIHSLANGNFGGVISTRPLRSPHHSASNVAIIGGGHSLRPGEISLSHRGVLFLDELPEFNRVTIEALRQPLEDRVVHIVRAKDTAQYPANFILIGTANPCPCGYYGTRTECRCMPHQIIRYQQKLSGPILDRIDLFANVHEIDHKQLLKNTRSVDDDTTLKNKVQAVRKVQEKRFGASQKLNSDMTNQDIKNKAKLDPAGQEILNTAAERLKLSPRSYMRIIKVARTIADLDCSEKIDIAHVSEALQYRGQLSANS